MGIVVSYFLQLRLVISSIVAIKRDFEKVESRLAVSPGIPVGSPSVSVWQAPPHSTLSNRQSSPEDFPRQIDVLIIGSGIAGCSIAKTLLEGTRDLRVAILDAREVCSGATGRNGGHIKDTPYFDYEGLRKKHGIEAARLITRFRMNHLRRLIKLAQDLGLEKECEIREVETVDAFLAEGPWKDAVHKLNVFLGDFQDQKDVYHVFEQDEARSAFSLPTAVGVITSRAGALSPYSLVTSVLSDLLSTHPNLFIEANTPVLGIEPPSSELQRYVIETSRGKILASHVVHATNAFSPNLLPGLREKIVPVRAQMTSLLPVPQEPSLPGGSGRSWSFFFDRGFDYLTIRPSGHLMLGGGWAQSGNNGLDDVGITSDRDNSLLAVTHLLGVLPSVFDKSVLSGVQVDAMWTGTIGMSVDLLPWVGKVPENVSGRKAGKGTTSEWVCAGFSGEGMVNAWGCGEALGKMILGDDVLTNFPKEMIITEQRVKKANLVELAEAWS